MALLPHRTSNNVKFACHIRRVSHRTLNSHPQLIRLQLLPLFESLGVGWGGGAAARHPAGMQGPGSEPEVAAALAARQLPTQAGGVAAAGMHIQAAAQPHACPTRRAALLQARACSVDARGGGWAHGWCPAAHVVVSPGAAQLVGVLTPEKRHCTVISLWSLGRAHVCIHLYCTPPVAQGQRRAARAAWPAVCDLVSPVVRGGSTPAHKGGNVCRRFAWQWVRWTFPCIPLIDQKRCNRAWRHTACARRTISYLPFLCK